MQQVNTNMNNAQINIIYAMEGNIFNRNDINPKIILEVPFFKRILEENKLNHEVFHGYVNKLNEVWFEILTDSFKRIIMNYNREYESFREREYLRNQRMMSLANEMATDELLGDLGDLGLSTSISSLTKDLGRSGISKKGPSKKKLKK